MQHDNLVAHALYVIRRCPRADTVAHGLSGSAIVCWPSLWRVGVYQGAAREGMRREAWERTEEGLIFNGADENRKTPSWARRSERHCRGRRRSASAFSFWRCSYGVLMGTRGFFVPVAHVHERVHLHRFHGIRHRESAGVRVQPVRHVHAGRHARYPSSVLRHLHARPGSRTWGAKKPYLIFSLCDETFAIDNGTIIAADVDRGWFYFFVGLLNQSSWVPAPRLAAFSENVINLQHLGLDFIMIRHVRRHFDGSMADHETQKPHGRAYRHSGARDLSGGCSAPDNFMIPSLVAMLVMFISAAAIPGRPEDRQDGRGERNEQRGQGDERMMIMTTWQASSPSSWRCSAPC